MQQIPFVLRTAQSEDNLLRACILASNIPHAPIIFVFPGFSNPNQSPLKKIEARFNVNAGLVAINLIERNEYVHRPNASRHFQ